MKEERKLGSIQFSSISDFFMNNCECSHSSNWYYSWKCMTEKCKQCKTILSPKSRSEAEKVFVTYSQLEDTRKSYEHKKTKKVI